MADFSALKTSIQNYIKQNGNEEITGNLLQQILLSMVSTLGDSAINDLVTALNAEIANRGNADTELGGNITTLQGVVNGIKSNVENGYVYAGIATPSTTPVSGKVFYLALTAGTYTNFGSIVVPQGINILKYNGSAWSLDSFLGLDDAPTQGSNNLVKSGGVLDSIIKDGSAFDLSAYNNGATYADLSAALTALNGLPAAYKKGGMSVKFVQTSDNKYIQARCMAQNFTTDTTQWQGVDDEPTAGSDSLVKSGGARQYVCNGLEKSALSKGSIILNNIEEGYFWTYSNGEFVKISNAAFNINHYYVSQTSIAHIKARVPYTSYILFFDANNKIIYSYTGDSIDGYNVDRDFYIPSDCVKIDISYANELDVTTQAIDGYNTRLKELESTYEQIEKTLYGKLKLSSTEDGAFYSTSEGDKNTSIADFSIAHFDIIEPINIIHIKGRTVDAAYILFFSENNTIISYTTGNSGSGINTDDDYTVPSGCTHFGISYVNTYDLTVTTPNGNGVAEKLKELDDFVNPNYFRGKKIGLIGDSIAANGGFITECCSIIGATFKNAAIGGWTLGDAENTAIYKQINGISPSTKQLDGDEDLIVIFAGTNDFGHAYEIGDTFTTAADGKRTANAVDATTSGGLSKAILTLYQKYGGYIPIIICTPLQRKLAGSSSSGGSWDKNTRNLYMDDYIEGIRKMAQFYGIPVFDAYNINMNPNIEAANIKYFDDGLHPNTLGHKLIGRALALFIKNNMFDV